MEQQDVGIILAHILQQLAAIQQTIQTLLNEQPEHAPILVAADRHADAHDVALAEKLLNQAG